MSGIKPDPFWDGKTGGGLRCSSVGEDTSRYLDPSTQNLEGSGGRSIASLLPGSYGLRGVVIPRATVLGGSRGFDPNKPRLVNIDPDIKGQSCVVDLSKITKESMEQAFLEAAENPVAQTDIRLLAAQTFHNLAVGYEPVGMGPAEGPRLAERRAPLGSGLGTYVVPRASLGGGQILDEAPPQPLQSRELMSPSVQPRGPILPTGFPVKRAAAPRAFKLNESPDNMMPNVGMPPAAVQAVDSNGQSVDMPQEEYYQEEEQMPAAPPQSRFRDQTQQKQPRKVVLQGPPPQQQQAPPVPLVRPTEVSVPPNTKVTFEMEGWGTFEANYHEVIKNDCLLVLVYDTRYKGGMKFFPQASKNLIAISVDGTDTIYFVNSYGNRFEHAGYEYCILVIDQEGNNKVTAPVAPVTVQQPVLPGPGELF